MVESAFPILTTGDLERALGFYRDVLGGVVSYAFPPEGPPAYVGVDLGSSHLGIGHDTAVDLEAPQRIALWVYVADCDAAVAAVRAAGGTVLEEPVDQPWGERVARVADPDGNRIVVGARLG
jgi:lactoylglutathione lyase